jgi:transposase-like protein
MPIDHTGTAPGLAQSTNKPEAVHLRCKSPDCDSMLAIEISAPGAGQRLYQCCKCHRTSSVLVGGSFSL